MFQIFTYPLNTPPIISDITLHCQKMQSIKELVKIEGIIEIRFLSDDVDHQEMNPEDLYCFLQTFKEIPENYCKKDKLTGLQKVFFCQVCDCDLRDVEGLRKHLLGKKHTSKALMKKRLVLGLELMPQNAPRKKEGGKRPRPIVDVGLTLEQRLRDSALPALGLDFISEFIDPKDARQHPLYTCSLQGCNSAWGTSDDMFHHVTNYKHQKNFLKMQNPNDDRINGFTRDKMLSLALEYEEDEGGPDARDYKLIKIVSDYKMYRKLLDRPSDWSEKKAKFGLVV